MGFFLFEGGEARGMGAIVWWLRAIARWHGGVPGERDYYFFPMFQLTCACGVVLFPYYACHGPLLGCMQCVRPSPSRGGNEPRN